MRSSRGAAQYTEAAKGMRGVAVGCRRCRTRLDRRRGQTIVYLPPPIMRINEPMSTSSVLLYPMIRAPHNQVIRGGPHVPGIPPPPAPPMPIDFIISNNVSSNHPNFKIYRSTSYAR